MTAGHVIGFRVSVMSDIRISAAAVYQVLIFCGAHQSLMGNQVPLKFKISPRYSGERHLVAWGVPCAK